MADGKLLKILSKIAGKLTYLKDVITITEPCAPHAAAPPVSGSPLNCCPPHCPAFARLVRPAAACEAATRIARSHH